MIKAVLWLGMLTTSFAANAGVVIENVTIVDVINGRLNPAQNVFISGDKIVEIQSNTVPGKHQRIDGSGQYLLPGLWDMHTHLANKPATNRLRLFIANGVTGVREMFSDCNPCNPYQLNLEQMNDLRQDINTHKRLGPRLLALSAPIVDLQGKTAINNFVKQAKKRGADFIKTYTNLPRQS
ncbi:MAG: hypothetical protein MJK04_30500, partial [Psychrosphaera sp.]|nr:hypothetical protein [Psychrosphaera sp.]